MWVQKFDNNNETYRTFDFALDPNYNISCIGSFYGTLDFDPGVGVYSMSSNAGKGKNAATNPDIFILKLSQSPCPAPSQPGTISGPTSICGSGTATYSVAPVSGAQAYNWTLPAGWSGSSNGNSITVTPGTTGGTISVTAGNNCGVSTSSSLAVTVSSSPAPSPTIIQSGNDLIAPTGYVAYQWYMDGSPIAGANSNIYSTTASGSYYVIVTDVSGCTGQSNTINISKTKGGGNGGGPKNKMGDNNGEIMLSLYPNPAKEYISIKGEIFRNNSATLKLMDISGKIYQERQIETTNGNISEDFNISQVASGIYIILIISDQQTQTIQFVKE